MGLRASSDALPGGRRGGEKTDWWASITTKVERRGGNRDQEEQGW